MKMNGMTNQINVEEFTRELENLTKQTPADYEKASEQARALFIMDAEKWTRADKKKLIKADLSIDDIVNLELFYDMWQKFWVTSLIRKEFIKYKGNIKQIMAMHIKLRDAGIATFNNYFFPKALNELCEVIQTKHDFEVFVEIWEKTKHKNGYLQVLEIYKKEYLGVA